MPPSNTQHRLLAPGPVPLPEEVRELLGANMIHHRSPGFKKVLQDVLKDLRHVFQTTQPVMLHSSTGSGAMESALVNTLSPGDEILCIVSGKFGQRWAEMAKAHHLNVHTLNVEWGRAAASKDVEAFLTKHPNTQAVLCQACETSTGVIHPIKEIAKLTAKNPHTLLIVDAISALGALPLKMDDWGLDVVVAGSQKAFMLPAGLSCVALSQKAWEFNAKARCSRYYFDLEAEKKANDNAETNFSGSVNMIRALNMVLKTYFNGDQLVERMQRCQKLALATRRAITELGLNLLAERPSPSVTAFYTPPEFDSTHLKQWMEDQYNVTVLDGQGPLKGKILRIGHLGAITNDDLQAGIEALGKTLVDFSWNKASSETTKAVAENTKKLLERGD